MQSIDKDNLKISESFLSSVVLELCLETILVIFGGMKWKIGEDFIEDVEKVLAVYISHLIHLTFLYIIQKKKHSHGDRKLCSLKHLRVSNGLNCTSLY